MSHGLCINKYLFEYFLAFFCPFDLEGCFHLFAIDAQNNRCVSSGKCAERFRKCMKGFFAGASGDGDGKWFSGVIFRRGIFLIFGIFLSCCFNAFERGHLIGGERLD